MKERLGGIMKGTYGNEVDLGGQGCLHGGIFQGLVRPLRHTLC